MLVYVVMKDCVSHDNIISDILGVYSDEAKAVAAALVAFVHWEQQPMHVEAHDICVQSVLLDAEMDVRYLHDECAGARIWCNGVRV
jgi:uncharacterized protein (DUF362 family)